MSALPVAGAVAFWIAAALLAWTYMLYPVTIGLLARYRGRPWHRGPYRGTVTLVIPAHNEQAVIREKIDNALALEPGESDLEIVVVSDGSDDGTAAILDGYRGHAAAREGRLKLIAYAPRAGKPTALHHAVLASKGAVLVFSDANVFLERDALPRLLAPLADPMVGAVCGRVDVVSDRDGTVPGEGLYMRYEGLAQRAEARVWTTMGVDGALYALRRNYYRQLEPDMVLDDLALSMEVVLAGRRIVYADDARATELAPDSDAGDFLRKKRIIGGGFQFLARRLAHRAGLGARAWAMFFSHKILRWGSPLLLLAAAAGCLLAWPLHMYRALLGMQGTFYVLALAGALWTRLRGIRLVYLPYYFVVINLAAAAGFITFLGGRQGSMWQRAGR